MTILASGQHIAVDRGLTAGRDVAEMRDRIARAYGVDPAMLTAQAQARAQR